MGSNSISQFPLNSQTPTPLSFSPFFTSIMEERAIKMVTVSELIRRSRPLSGTSSLTSTRPISPSKQQKNTQPSDQHSKSSFPPNSTTSDQNPNPNPKFLKPLNYPATLIGILTPPSSITTTDSSSNQSIRCSNPCCLQFSDESATVCCDILDLDIRIVGKKIYVLSWNFIPTNSCGGFLEIISWTSPADNVVPSPLNQSLSTPISFSIPLVNGFVGKETSFSLSRGIRVSGLVESVSPVFSIPCPSSGHSGSVAKNDCGFLAKILVCECELCTSKVREIINNEECHHFAKSVVVYFTGSASSWYSVISRLVGSLVSFSGLKKKLVHLGKEESHIMYSTTERTSLHLSKDHNLFTRCPQRRKPKIEKMGDCCMHTGIITGIYMRGMVVELDQNILLLLTDHQLCLPHSIRVGAIVSVKNVHFVYPKYSWTKVVILGSCFKTSILVKAFSPMEIGLQQFLPSHSLLGKLINSLAFSARLWVLLVVSALNKKFAGILSEKEILGTKNTEGLAQKYSTSCLPLSLFRLRHGVFTEFFTHESCCCGNEPIYDHPKLVVPISNFIGYCEEYVQKMLLKTNSDIMGSDNQCSSICCNGRSYKQPIRRILKSEDINVILLGCLKVSQHSGRLQLVDATGSIDIVIPDLPSNCSLNDIHEIKDYNVILEGTNERRSHPESLVNESFSCKSIFNSFQLPGQRNYEMYIYCHLRNDESRNSTLYSSIHKKENFEELESGSFHLLWVTHKFPVQPKFPGNHTVSCKYAEVVILPWNLFLPKKDGVIWPPMISGHHQTDQTESDFSSANQENAARKRCKVDLASNGPLITVFTDAGRDLFGQKDYSRTAGRSSNDEPEYCGFSCPGELGCSIMYRSTSNHCISSGTLLHVRGSRMPLNPSSRICRKKVLLEFGTDSFCKYELLRIGGFFVIKHHKEDVVCDAIGFNAFVNGKVVINSTTQLWRILVSNNDGVPLKIGPSCFHLNVSNKEAFNETSHPFEIPFSRFAETCPKFCTDIYINLSADALSSFEAEFKALEEAFTKPSTLREEVVNNSQSAQIKSVPGRHLPVGNFLSIRGQVLAVHKSDNDPLSRQVSHKGSYDVHPRHFCNGVMLSCICIHVLMDDNIVKIFSSLSTYAYPIGFGAGVEVTFYRALALSQDSLMLTPASFIVINSITQVDTQYGASCNDIPAPIMENDVSLETLPSTLIFESLQCLEYKWLHFNCKVVAVYFLMLEKNNEVLPFHSRSCSRRPLAYIPLAGFLIDDGSSLCCCWANGENASTLLRLNEGIHQEASRKSLNKSQKLRNGRTYNSTIGRIDKIIKRYGQVTVKNYGSMFDSSCLDFAFTASTSDVYVSSSDEEFLKLTILNACISTIWNVAGMIMDSNAISRVEKILGKLDMKVLPVQNIWASKISHSEPIKEARNIVEELLRL